MVFESQPAKRSFFDCFRRNKTYRTNYYGDREILLNQPVGKVFIKDKSIVYLLFNQTRIVFQGLITE